MPNLAPDDQRARLCALFEMIGASSPEGSGALHFGGAPLGSCVLFDLGRVCWAAVPGIGRKLITSVGSLAGVPVGEVMAMCEESRRSGLPVSRALVERRLISPEALRELLRRQIAETLIQLSDEPDAPVWVAHRGRGYQAQFTFSVLEIVATAASTWLALDPEPARAELTALVEGFGVGAAFDIDSSHERSIGEPIVIASTSDEYELVRALGNWVATVSTSWSSISEFTYFAVNTEAGSAVAWKARGLTFGARFPQQTGCARIIASLTRRSSSS
jgi:hypothetical protein